MDELAVLPQSIRVDQRMPDRAILASQPCRVFVQRLPARQTGENVLDRGWIDVKLGDIAAQIFFTRIAEQIQLGLVHPDNDPLGSDPVQTDRGVVEKVAELLFAASQSQSG